MRKLGWAAVVVVVVALAVTAMAYAPARTAPGPVQVAQGPGGGGPGGQMSEADRAKMRDQMIDRMLGQAGLNDTEKAGAKRALKAKDEARRLLSAALDKLRGVANASNSSNAQLQNALTAYRTALALYRKKTADADAALANQLSLRSHARCLALGILDNGLGFGGGRMGGGGMRGTGRGGPGGTGGA